MGIAQIAIGPPSPHSNGHSVAPIFGQNHVNARLYMVISPKNRCHKPSWQGFRPPAPNGQCPNELLYFYGGASLTLGLASPGIGISKFCFHRDLPSFDHTTTNRTTPISVKSYFKQKDFGEKWICFIKVKQLETSPSWHFSIFPFSPKFTNTHLISVLI